MLNQLPIVKRIILHYCKTTFNINIFKTLNCLSKKQTEFMRKNQEYLEQYVNNIYNYVTYIHI